MTGSHIFGSAKTPISNYTGTMVHGKLTGHVTTVDHGKTYHATFADGHKKGRWIRGPYVAKAEAAEAAEPAEKSARTEPATSTEAASESASTGKISEEKPKSPAVEETMDIPAQGPEEPEVTDQKSEVSKPVTEEENVQRPTTNAQRPVADQAVKKPGSEATAKASPAAIAQTSTAKPEEPAAPRESGTKKAALAPGAVHAIERPTHTVTKKSETEPARQPEPIKPERIEKATKVAKSAPSQPPKADAELSEDIPAEGPPPVASEKIQTPASKPAIAQSSPPPVKETSVDNSIRTLTGPPSSLHRNPPPETNPPSQIPSPATAPASTPPPAGPKLTAVQAMDIADIEARTKGYDLGEYQLPKAEYNAANDTWSVGYIAREGDNSAKKLSVTIQDKTGKAEVRK